jgi:hypothetical protein
MSSIAVFLMLGGATALAATKIGANELKANSIKTGKIVKEAVTAGKIKVGAVTESRIADLAVTTPKIADLAVTTPKIADNAVTTGKIADNAVTTGKLANSSVNSAKIQDGQVRAADLGSIIQVTNSAPVANTAFASVSANCPAGTTVIAGGFQPANFGVEATSSLRAGNGWQYQAVNNSGGASTAVVFAYCLSG